MACAFLLWQLVSCKNSSSFNREKVMPSFDCAQDDTTFSFKDKTISVYAQIFIPGAT